MIRPGQALSRLNLPADKSRRSLAEDSCPSLSHCLVFQLSRVGLLPDPFSQHLPSFLQAEQQDIEGASDDSEQVSSVGELLSVARMFPGHQLSGERSNLVRCALSIFSLSLLDTFSLLHEQLLMRVWRCCFVQA